MSKFEIGQEVFWFKWADDMPDLRSFKVGTIKQTKKGFSYATGEGGNAYVEEKKLYPSVEDAIEGNCELLKNYNN